MRRPAAALLPLALLALLPLALLLPALRPGHALLSVSQEQLSPWRVKTEPARLAELERESLPLAADKTLMFEPELRLAQRRMLEGQAPLWTPDVLCGVPLLAQAVHGALSPPVLLAAALGPTRAWALICALQLAVAGVLMYLQAREYGLRAPAALLAGASFALCGYLAVRLEWYQIQGASIWLPGALLAVERAFRSERDGPARAGAVALLGLAIGLSLLAGFPQGSVHILYAAAALSAARLVSAWRRGERAPARRAALVCAAGALLGLLLGAPQLLPSAAFASGDDSTRTSAPPEAVAGLAMEPAGLLGALVPDLFGHPRDLAAHALPQLRQDGVLRLLLLRPGSNWVETTCTIGVPTLLLALLGLFAARRGARVAAVLFVAGAFLAVRTPLLPLVLRLPGLDTGDPRRFLLLFSAGGALLAGFGLQRLLDGEVTRAQSRLLIALAAVPLLAALATSMLAGPAWADLVAPRLAAKAGLPEAEVRAQDAELQLDLQLLRDALLRAALFAAATAAVVAFTARRRAVAHVALLLALADLFCFASRARTVLPVPAEPPDPPGLAALLDTGGGRVARFVPASPRHALSYPLPPDTGLPLGVRDLSGYITLAPRRVEALHEHLQAGTSTGIGVAALSDWAALDSPLLDVFAVTRVLSTVPIGRAGFTELGRVGDAWLVANDSALPRARLASRVRLVADEAAAEAALRSGLDLREEVVVEAAGLPEFEAAAAGGGAPGEARLVGSARLVVDEPERLVIEVAAARPAVLVVADSFASGWEATLDGAPAEIRPADLAFRAVAVPAGGHRVEMVYRAPGWRAGLLAGAAGVLGLIGCALLGLRSARSAARPPSGPPAAPPR